MTQHDKSRSEFESAMEAESKILQLFQNKAFQAYCHGWQACEESMLEKLKPVREALTAINGFAEHDEDCKINDWHDTAMDSCTCTCGYIDAFRGYREALALLDEMEKRP